MNYVRQIMGVSFCLLLMETSSLFAQPSGVQQNDRVRVYAPTVNTHKIIGSIYEVSPSVIRVSSRGRILNIPLLSIRTLELSQGRKRNTGKGFLVGIGTGGLLGGLTGAFTYTECNEEGFMSCFLVPESRGDAFLTGAAIGGLFGGVVGLIAGIATKSDRWEQVPVQVAFSSFHLQSKETKLYPVVGIRINLK